MISVIVMACRYPRSRTCVVFRDSAGYARSMSPVRWLIGLVFLSTLLIVAAAVSSASAHELPSVGGGRSTECGTPLGEKGQSAASSSHTGSADPSCRCWHSGPACCPAAIPKDLTYQAPEGRSVLTPEPVPAAPAGWRWSILRPPRVSHALN